jgi:hypothetical protein
MSLQDSWKDCRKFIKESRKVMQCGSEVGFGEINMFARAHSFYWRALLNVAVTSDETYR